MLSLSTGYIPSDWLFANVTPAYNKGRKELPVNYCSITLTYVCSKVIEHIIMRHLNENDVLSSI